MRDKKYVIYTGAFRFPEMDAAATRVHLVGECLGMCNYQVEYLSWADGDAAELKQYRGFMYRNMGEFRTRKVNFFTRAFGFVFMGRKTLGWLLKSGATLKALHAIILYNPPVFFALSVILLSKFYRFSVVLDSTEWYEAEHLPGGKFGLVALENYFRMRWVYPLFKNCIAISHFLEAYYNRKKHVNCLYLPALCEPVASFIPHVQGRGAEVSIIYAGNAGKKDRLHDVIRALPCINQPGSIRVHLELYGPTDIELQSILSLAELSAAQEFMTVHGRVSRQQVIAAYSKASFSILFREHKRYALAGFPTKAVESWSAGVPVITNAVGDLASYCNVKNSIVIEAREFSDAMLNIVSNYSSSMAEVARVSCLNTASDYFSVEHNHSRVMSFMERLVR